MILQQILSLRDQAVRFTSINYFRSSLSLYYNSFELISYLRKRLYPFFTFEDVRHMRNGVTIHCICITRRKLEELNTRIKIGGKRVIIHGGRAKAYYVTGLCMWVDNHKLIVNEQNGNIFCSDKDRNELLIVSDNSHNLHNDTERVIRDILSRSHEYSEKAFHFHGSAVEYPGTGKCILMIGRRNSGKTTFLVHLLVEHHLSYLTNDNSFVSYCPEGGYFLLVPWPYYCNVKRETIERYAEIYGQILNSSLEQNAQGKFRLFTGDVIKLFKTRVSLFSHIGAIISLSYNDNNVDRIKRITDEDKYGEIIDDNSYIPHDPEHPNFTELVEDFALERLIDYDSLKSNLYKSVPLFELQYSVDWKGFFDHWLTAKLIPFLKGECQKCV